MSRCFPYPPPGYILSKEKNEALIELIKLQKEREKLKEKRREKIERRMEKKKKMMERKERSKERKERSKEKKERKERLKEKKDEASQKVDKSDIVNCHERMDAETEQSPQSGLTEEHGHSDSVPVPSSSYDSTENNKRKRHSSPTEDIHGHGEANPMSLLSKWQSDFHTLAKGLQHTGDSGLRDAPENLCHASGKTSSREEICLTSGKSGNRSSLNAVSREVELQCKHLLKSWFPPNLHDAGLYPVDSDWLYPDRRNQDTRQAEKRQRSRCDSISCPRSSTVWSCAKYLPEVDVYALPYVVPY